MTKTFLEKLEQFAANLGKRFPPDSKREVDLILAEGVQSSEDLLAFIQSEQADPELRQTSIWLTSILDVQEAIPVLIMLTEHPIDKIRFQAIVDLGMFKATEAVDTITKVFHQKDQDHWTQMVCLHALGEIGSPNSSELLATIVQDKSQRPELRGQAIEALGYLQNGGDFVPLYVELLRDESPWVRYDAIYALGHRGSAEHIPLLEEIIQSDDAVLPWGSLREEAEHSIKCIHSMADED